MSLESFAMAYLPPIYKRLFEALEAQDDLSLEQLAVAACVERETARRAVTRLRRAKIIRISKWRPSRSGPHTPYYSLGQGDEKQPVKKSKALIAKECRAKKKVLCGAVRLGMFGI